MKLTKEDKASLQKHGIHIEYDGAGGNVVTLGLQGMWAIFNYLRASCRRGTRLDLRVFKSVAEFDFDNHASDAIKVVAPVLPTHESRGSYRRISMYLDNSPPTFLHDFPPMNGGVGTTYQALRDTYRGGVGVFVLSGSMTLNLQFSGEEAAALNRGEAVSVRAAS